MRLPRTIAEWTDFCAAIEPDGCPVCGEPKLLKTRQGGNAVIATKCGNERCRHNFSSADKPCPSPRQIKVMRWLHARVAKNERRAFTTRPESSRVSGIRVISMADVLSSSDEDDPAERKRANFGSVPNRAGRGGDGGGRSSRRDFKGVATVHVIRRIIAANDRRGESKRLPDYALADAINAKYGGGNRVPAYRIALERSKMAREAFSGQS